MAKLTARQLILPLPLFALFSPVFLPIGAPEPSPAWLVSGSAGARA